MSVDTKTSQEGENTNWDCKNPRTDKKTPNSSNVISCSKTTTIQKLDNGVIVSFGTVIIHVGYSKEDPSHVSHEICLPNEVTCQAGVSSGAVVKQQMVFPVHQTDEGQWDALKNQNGTKVKNFADGSNSAIYRKTTQGVENVRHDFCTAQNIAFSISHRADNAACPSIRMTLPLKQKRGSEDIEQVTLNDDGSVLYLMRQNGVETRTKITGQMRSKPSTPDAP